MRKRTAILIIIFVGLALYFNIFFNDFVWDDWGYVDNVFGQSIKNFFYFLKGIGAASNDYLSYKSVFYRPLASVYYAIIPSVFGLTPFYFHFFQLIFHILNSVLLFLLFSRLFKNSKHLAFFLSMVFLVHPANVETVSFIMSAQEILFFTFGSLALFLIITMKEEEIKKIILVNTLLFCSLLFKETGFVFFIIAFFYLLFFKKKLVVLNTFYSVVLLLFYFFLRLIFGSWYYIGTTGVSPISRADFITRIYTMPKIFLYYITKFFYPINLTIADQWTVKKPDFDNFYLPLIFCLIIITSMVLYIYKTGCKRFFLFFIWSLSGLGIYSQIVPLNMTVAERWLYFSMVGLLGMIGVLIEKTRLDQKKITGLILIVMVVVFSLRSFVRTFDWRNEVSLFTHDVKYAENNYALQLYSANALTKAKRYKEAEPHYKKSLKLLPYHWETWNNLGVLYVRTEKYDKAEKMFIRSIKENPYYFLAHKNLVLLLIKQKKTKQAEDLIKKDLVIFPNSRELRYLYGKLLELNNLK